MAWLHGRKVPALPVSISIGTLLLVTSVLLILLYGQRNVPIGPHTEGGLTEAPKPKPARKVKVNQMETQGPIKIEFLNKHDLALKMNWPEVGGLADPIIAVGEVPPHEGKTSVISTMGADADNVWRGKILYRHEPIPLFGVPMDAGLRGGIGTGRALIFEAYVRPLRVKDVTLEGRAFWKGSADETDMGAIILMDWRFHHGKRR
jgi:hypothetical protein